MTGNSCHFDGFQIHADFWWNLFLCHLVTWVTISPSTTVVDYNSLSARHNENILALLDHSSPRKLPWTPSPELFEPGGQDGGQYKETTGNRCTQGLSQNVWILEITFSTHLHPQLTILLLLATDHCPPKENIAVTQTWNNSLQAAGAAGGQVNGVPVPAGVPLDDRSLLSRLMPFFSRIEKGINMTNWASMAFETVLT